MKSIAIFSISIVCALSCFADANKKPTVKERQKRMMIATGGMAEKPGIGKIVVVNAQNKISKEVINSVVDKLIFQTKFNVEVISGNYMMYVKPDEASAAIVLAEDDKLPLSVIAVENLWGLLNVAKLGDKNIDARFTKEFIRVTTIAFGASLSRFNGSPLSSVTNASMLDRYPTDNYTFDCQQAIVKNLCNLGMSPIIRTSYKKACQEGWAPAPTNEYQKAVWDKVHAMPTAPIKIKPESKKVKE
jgi:hypothetical protein